MKRWLVVLLLTLAVLILISPGIVGRLAEKNIADNIEWAESDSPGVNIQTESFERGWFNSEGRHRIALDGLQFGEVTEQYRQATGNAELPSLIIDTRLEHGPLPGGSLSPGLATSVSTFQIDPGNGEAFTVPGALTSKVGLSGESESRLLLEAGSFEHESATFAWQGVEMDVTSNPSNGAISVEGEVRPWSISADEGVAEISAMTINATQVRSDFGFNVGNVELDVGEISVRESVDAFSIGGISLRADTDVDDERLNANSVFSMQSMSVPMFGEVDFDMDLTLTGADAASIAVVGKAFQDAQGSVDPEAAFANLYPQIEDELQVLFQKGFEMRLDQFDIALPQGVIATRMSIEVAETDDDGPFNWSSVLLNMNADLDLRIPGAVYEMAAMMNSQAGSLVAMGLLVPDGDDYIMNAEYAQGLVNVNGAPMPIPMPMQ
jgi:uncharacterized protein YdgA (DUF945 family)